MGRAIVTGGAGFIGSHLCESLMNDGYEVVVLDNLSSGRAANLNHLRDRDGFSFHEHDVTNEIDLGGDIDWVLHLASLASPKFYGRHPIDTLRVGSTGTENTLELARSKDASYLFASTSEVYGDPEVNPQPESYRGNVDPVGPRACYDESKRYGEALTVAYRDEHGLDVRIPRIFNTYGPRMREDDGRVIPNFVTQALGGRDLTVYGDGSQTRSFCYVDDLVRGMRALMESDVQEPVNLGNPDERTIDELADLVIDLTGAETAKTYEPLPPQDPEVRRPDVSKAESLLMWNNLIELAEGLEMTIEWFKGS